MATSEPAALASLAVSDESATSRGWIKRGTLTLLDQAAFSTWGLLVNLFAGRWNTSATYGVFAVSFAVLMFVGGFETAFVLEPMAVFGRGAYVERLLDYVAAQLRLFPLVTLIRTILLLGTATVVAAIATTGTLPHALVAAAVSGAFIMFGWFARQVAYVLGKPKSALAGNLAALLVTVGLGAYLGHGDVGVVAPYIVLGGAGLTLGVVTLVSAGVRSVAVGEQGIRIRDIARTQLTYGRWPAVQNVLYAGSTHIFVLVIGSILGFGAAGEFRAALLVASPITYAVSGFSMLLLPSLAEDFGHKRIGEMRRKTRWAAGMLSATGFAYAALTVIGGQSALHFLYGSAYTGHSGLVPLCACALAVGSAGTCFSLMLRAVRWPIHQVLAGLPTAAVAVSLSIPLTRHFGLAGAAWTLLGTYVTATLLMWLLYRWRSTQLALSEVRRA